MLLLWYAHCSDSINALPRIFTCCPSTVQEKVPLKGSRGSANIVAKCKLCARENSLGKLIRLSQQPVVVVLCLVLHCLCLLCLVTNVYRINWHVEVDVVL